MFYSIGVVFILVNMFLSIIIENFNKRVKRNKDLQSNECKIVDFVTAVNELVGIEVVIDFLPKGISSDRCRRRENGPTKLRNWRRVDWFVTLIQTGWWWWRRFSQEWWRNDLPSIGYQTEILRLRTTDAGISAVCVLISSDTDRTPSKNDPIYIVFLKLSTAGLACQCFKMPVVSVRTAVNCLSSAEKKMPPPSPPLKKAGM